MFKIWGSSGQKVQIWRGRKWDMLGQIGLYLRKYKHLVKEVY